MRKGLTLLIISLLLFAISDKASASKDAFSVRMQEVVSGAEKGDEVIGVSVVSLNSGDILYAHKDGVPLNPASCTKIITTAAALKLLGPSYKFHTKFYTDQRPVGGKVGKMWVKGYGDPSIVIERLWRMARDIANTGLKKIDGDIIVDDSYFEGYKYPGYREDSGFAYNSLTGAASLNYNTVTIIISPASRTGAPPHVVPDSAGPYFRIINTAITGARGSKNTIKAARTQKDGEDVIIVSGSIPVESASLEIYRNITNPPLYFGLALKSLLQQNGITVGGNVLHGNFPGGTYLLMDSVSKPLSLIARDMNKYSNNFIAEQVLNTLGAEIGGAPGSTLKGVRVIENFLTHIGIPQDSYKIVNGSGLTQENRISASTLVTVLANMFADPRISPEAIASFSTAGVDGTIEERYTSDRLKGLVRAKTGSLYGVSTLTGIVPSSSGETLGYAIMMNGNGLSWTASHKLQEEMLDAMASFLR